MASYDLEYRFRQISRLGRPLIPRTSRLRGSSNAPEARLLRQHDKSRRRYRDYGKGMSGQYRDYDNGMSGQYGDSHFGEGVKCPDAGMERGVVPPEGHAAPESVLDRPLSPMAAIFGLSGILSRIITGFR